MLRFFPGIEGMGGHRIRPYLDYESATKKKLEYITILRSPIDRYLSHYFHHINNGISKMTLKEFIEIPYFQNFMCRKICGEPSSDLTIKIVNQKNIKILFLEDIARFEKKNLGVSTTKYSSLMENCYEDIEKCNLEDIKLYQYFKERGSDHDYFKRLIGNPSTKVARLSSFQIRIIQEIFQRLIYYMCKKKSKGLKRGF
jgi:hypothetical protein